MTTNPHATTFEPQWSGQDLSRRRSSFAAGLARDTFRRTGARVGASWIVVLLVSAVFAPFLANSHPLLIATIDGQWSSPLLKHLTVADVSILVGAVTAVVLVGLYRVRLAKKILIFLSVLTVALLVGVVFVRPPQAVVYSQYREARAQGQVKWALYTPIPFSPTDYQRDQADARLQPPNKHHWLGTEVNGADLMSRMLYASRIALAIGLISTSIALVIGVAVGGVMGYFSGTVDMIGMRLVEIEEAIPTLFLLIIFVAFFERNLYLMMAIIGLTSWTGYCRFIRAEFLKLRQQDFIQAARACGLPLSSILFRHMLPNGIGPVLVSASFGVASAILAETTLSFLGLGLVDEPSWGAMLNQALGAGGTFQWWMAIFPGLAIFLTVFSYNMIGEALRDAIDPHQQRMANSR